MKKVVTKGRMVSFNAKVIHATSSFTRSSSAGDRFVVSFYHKKLLRGEKVFAELAAAGFNPGPEPYDFLEQKSKSMRRRPATGTVIGSLQQQRNSTPMQRNVIEHRASHSLHRLTNCLYGYGYPSCEHLQCQPILHCLGLAVQQSGWAEALQAPVAVGLSVH